MRITYNMKRKFRKIVKAHQDRLYSTAVHLLGQSGEAEEVVQDAFIKLWEHLDSLEEAHVLPWLIRVTRNGCLDLLRRRKVQLAYATGTGMIDTVTVTEPDEALTNLGLRERLRSAIETLKEPHRSLILLREVEGFSYADISEALDLSETQVKVYLHRARRKLRHRLEEDDQ